MSNKSRLQTNNTNLQALIDKANALPDAGSGGSGGASLETCTVTITIYDSMAYTGDIVGTTVNDAGVGELMQAYEALHIKSYEIVSRTVLYLRLDASIVSTTLTNATSILFKPAANSLLIWVDPDCAGTANITIYGEGMGQGD